MTCKTNLTIVIKVVDLSKGWRYCITSVFIISVILSPFSKIRPARNTETTMKWSCVSGWNESYTTKICIVVWSWNHLQVCVSSSSRRFPQPHPEEDSCTHQIPVKTQHWVKPNLILKPCMWKNLEQKVLWKSLADSAKFQTEKRTYSDAPFNPHVC
jgi:hypothetical protein